MLNNVDRLEDKGLAELTTIPAVENMHLQRDLKAVIQNLAKNNRLLRESQKVSSLEQMETKFKKLGGEDWKSSRFYPVICSVRVANIETKKQIEDSLLLTDILSWYGATLCKKQDLFRRSSTVIMEEQLNFYQLNSEFDTDDSRLIPQRTDKWFELRNTAMVTGSTCNKALGIGTLKQQQQHFDTVINKVDKADVSETVQRRMEYGTLHEIDAVATVTGKVLPFLYPDYNYYEEGCVKVPYKDHMSFMVVSPDGSFRKSYDGPALMMYENKCKAPQSFSSTAYYKIPDYYVVQLLCEKHAYSCTELMFTCWAEQSMTVFLVLFDAELWETCWNELTRLYGEKKSRPTRFSPVAKDLKAAVKKFTETNVTLLGEFPACRAFAPSSLTKDHVSPYVAPTDNATTPENATLAQLQESLLVTKTWFVYTYNLLRSVASEILVFMVNDLDRMYNMEPANAHPVAYALKGPSMKADVFSKMTEDLIAECEEKGINIVVTASDGQWHQFGVRDTTGRALTLHQLHRDHWSSVKAKDKSSILTEIKGTYKVSSLDDVNIERGESGLVVYGHKRDSAFFIHHWCSEEGTQDVSDELTDPNTEEESEGPCNNECIAGDFAHQIDTETQEEIDEVSSQLLPVGSFMNEIQNSVPSSYDFQEDMSWLFQTDHDQSMTESPMGGSRTPNINQTISVLKDAHDVVYGHYVPAEDIVLADDDII